MNRLICMSLALALTAFLMACDKEAGDPTLPEKGGNQVVLTGTYTYTQVDERTADGCILHVRQGKLVVRQLGIDIWGTLEDEIVDNTEVPETQRVQVSFHGTATAEKVILETPAVILDATLVGVNPPYGLAGKFYGSDFYLCSWEGRWTAVRR